jgi:hypothetical protein
MNFLAPYHDQAFYNLHRLQQFYRTLESPAAALAEASNKENFDAHHGDGIGDLADPFAQKNPYSNGGPSNPYIKRSFPSAKPYNERSFHSANSYNVTNATQPQAHVPTRAPYSNNNDKNPPPKNISPTLTQDQIQRIEENRKRAISIKMKRLQESS